LKWVMTKGQRSSWNRRSFPAFFLLLFWNFEQFLAQGKSKESLKKKLNSLKQRSEQTLTNLVSNHDSV
jgi:hypothetical protein